MSLEKKYSDLIEELTAKATHSFQGAPLGLHRLKNCAMERWNIINFEWV